MRFFHSFGIKDVLLKRLENFRIEKPTAIQEKVRCFRARVSLPKTHVYAQWRQNNYIWNKKHS